VESLVAALVLTADEARLRKCHTGRYAVVPALRVVMNAAARLILQSTPVDTTSHRCCTGCIGFMRLTYKLAVHRPTGDSPWTHVGYTRRVRVCPVYTWLTLYVSLSLGRQRLRSLSTSTLVVPLTRLSTISDRAFRVAAARTWNCLLSEVC